MKTKKEAIWKKTSEEEEEGSGKGAEMYERAVLHAVNQGLIQALALGNGLDNGSLRGYKADGPLPEPSAAQAEHIAVSAQRERVASVTKQIESRNEGCGGRGTKEEGKDTHPLFISSSIRKATGANLPGLSINP